MNTEPIQNRPNQAPEPTRGTGSDLFFQSRWPRVAQLGRSAIKDGMFYIFSLIPILVPAVLGAYMLFMPMERIIAGVAWMRLPMPKEGSQGYFLLRLFYRGLGVIAWTFASFAIYLVFVR